MIGAGFYLDDVELMIARKREALYRIIREHTIIISITLLVSILLSFLFVQFINSKIQSNLSRFINFFSKASTGNARIDLNKLSYQEFSELAVSANNMIEQRELAEQGFKQIVELFPFPICLYLNSEVLYLNPKWVETLGYTIEDLPSLDKMLLKCLPNKKERSKILFYKNNIRDNKFDLPDIFLNITIKNMKVRYMKLNFIAMKDKRTMITLEDYTIRKKFEEDLNLARIKAEEADSLKSAFLANMSHEIRTPMNAILGFSELLQKENLSDEKRHKYLTHINNSSQSLLNLINDILDISKIEAGQLNIQKEKSNLSMLFQSVDAEIKIIRSTMKKNHIEIQFRNNLSEEMDIIVTDSLRLKQILMNLLSNALKFTNEGLIEFGCSEDKDLGIRFYVKDSGIGIKENHLDDIFNRFTKIEEDLSKVFRGAGLGLAISKKLTEALGGKMWVESVYGKGSTFYFTLPVNNLH